MGTLEPPPQPSAETRTDHKTPLLHPRRLRNAVIRVRQRRAAPAPKRNLSALLREWHRRFGLFAFLFMGWLGFSGILLNEASNLELNSRPVSWPWLMSIYGLEATPPASGFGAAGHWLAVAGGKPALDGRRIETTLSSPLGLVASGDVLYVAQSESLVLLGDDGQRIDELRMPPLPIASIRRIGLIADRPGSIAIQGSDTAYESEDKGENWKAVPATEVTWSSRQPLPTAVRASLLELSQPSVSLQQILVDTHSGRLFGRYGSLFVDLVGALALALAVSGVWMTWRTSQARRKQAQSHAAAGARKA